MAEMAKILLAPDDLTRGDEQRPVLVVVPEVRVKLLVDALKTASKGSCVLFECNGQGYEEKPAPANCQVCIVVVCEQSKITSEMLDYWLACAWRLVFIGTRQTREANYAIRYFAGCYEPPYTQTSMDIVKSINITQ
jgi:hypothetical protein